MSVEIDLLTNFGTHSIKDVRARRLYNEEPNNNGLVIESVLSALDIKVDTNFTTSVSGNIIVGGTGYYDADLEQYWDVNAGTSACIHVGTEFCLNATGDLDFDGANMTLDLTGGITQTISGNSVENITGYQDTNVTTYVDINAGTSACITVGTDLCLNATNTLDLDGNDMTIDITNDVTENIGGDQTTDVTGHLGITVGTTYSLVADEITFYTTTFNLEGVTALSLCDGLIEVSDGTAGSPSYTFCTDQDTGLYLSGTNELSLSTAGTQQVVVDASGNVGIGSATPTQKLDVNGDILAQGGDLYLVDTNEAISSDGTDMFFTVAGTEQVRIDSSGNVGIGTNAPGAKLEVEGSSLLNGTVGISGATNITTDSATAFVVEKTDGEDCFVVDTLTCAVTFAGSISAETINVDNLVPLTGTDVGISGNLAVTGNLEVCGGIAEFDQGSAGAPSLTFCGDNDTGLYNSGADEVSIATAGTQQVVIDSSGNVGIGTNAPGAKLEVEGNTLLNGTVGISGATNITTDSATAFVVEKANGEDCFVIDTLTCAVTFAGEISIETLNVDNLVPLTGTDVGISGNLAVSGALSVCDSYIEVDAGTAGAPGYTFCGDLDTGLYLSGTNELSMTTSGTQRMVIGSTGNVGIGSATPTQTLDVNGDVLVQGGDLYLVDTNEAVSSNGTDMYFTVAGTEQVRIDSSGNVGIGTNAPGAKLEVEGSTILNGTLSVTGNTDITAELLVTVDAANAFVVEKSNGEDCFRVNTTLCKTFIEELGISGDLTVEGNLTVNGTQTILNTETINVDDNNIVLNGITSPTDATATGGGITLQGDNDYTIIWDENCIHSGYGVTAAWSFNQNISVESSLGYYIDCKIHHDETNLVVNTKSNSHAGALYLSTNDIQTTPSEGDWRIKTDLNAAGKEVLLFQRYDGGSWTTRSRMN
jgi:hypothetical protein